MDDPARADTAIAPAALPWLNRSEAAPPTLPGVAAPSPSAANHWTTPPAPPAPVPARVTSFSSTPDPNSPVLDVSDVIVALPDGTVVLDRVSFSARRGEFVAVVGPTGAGKSTLVRAMTGGSPPAVGTVSVLGSDLYANLDLVCPRIGAVPQDDIVHHELTVRQALTFAAELRVGDEAGGVSRTHRVDYVMRQLGLDERANVPISQLSGGQRKRTSVALELLGNTPVLVLDEPTSGLDPGYEQSVMDVLRSIADDGRAVVVVTHSVASLDRCDRLVMLAPGGRVAYSGPPSGALAHFGARDYPEVFHHLSANAVPNAHLDLTVAPARPRVPMATVRNPRSRDHLRTLVQRHLTVLRADRRNLMFLAGAPAVLAILILAVVGTDSLSAQTARGSADGRVLLGSLAVAACALGASNGVREIVREEGLYRRERALGVDRSTYLAAKVMVMGGITLAQAVLVVVVTMLPSGAPLWAHLLPTLIEVTVAVALTGFVALCIGLAVSAVVSSSEKAMTVVPVLFVVGYLFSGASVDLQSQPVMRTASYLIPTSWGVGASASSAELTETDRCNIAGACDWRWDSSTAVWLADLVALAVLAAVALALAEAALARKEPLPELQRDIVVRRVAASIVSRVGLGGMPDAPRAPPH
jgi:ABC-type multidrug transport system ATPase subunit